jgi:hypothetical protein
VPCSRCCNVTGYGVVQIAPAPIQKQQIFSLFHHSPPMVSDYLELVIFLEVSLGGANFSLSEFFFLVHLRLRPSLFFLPVHMRNIPLSMSSVSLVFFSLSCVFSGIYGVD